MSDSIQVPDSLPTDDKLYAMSLVAKMKDAADRVGAGFIFYNTSLQSKRTNGKHHCGQKDLDHFEDLRQNQMFV